MSNQYKLYRSENKGSENTPLAFKVINRVRKRIMHNFVSEVSSEFLNNRQCAEVKHDIKLFTILNKISK